MNYGLSRPCQGQRDKQGWEAATANAGALDFVSARCRYLFSECLHMRPRLLTRSNLRSQPRGPARVAAKCRLLNEVRDSVRSPVQSSADFLERLSTPGRLCGILVSRHSYYQQRSLIMRASDARGRCHGRSGTCDTGNNRACDEPSSLLVKLNF